jgi:hypothetical protein
LDFAARFVGGVCQQDKSKGSEAMVMSKRDFLIGSVAASSAVLLGRIDAAGQSGRRVIDAHTHW